MQPSAWTRRDTIGVSGAAMAAIFAAFYAYAIDPRRPTAAVVGNGWWSFMDQSRYLRATLAWAAGRLDPAEHWYLPGYPLLAVPFTWLTPANPFLLPDLALLGLTIWLVAALAGWLAPGWRQARVVGAGVAVASVLPAAAMEVWVTPWTSTPEAVLTLAGLLATLHVMARPGAWRMALALGLCVGAEAGVRPADAAVLGSVAGLAAGIALLQQRPGWMVAARAGAAATVGVVIAVLPTLIAYVAINGWSLNGYLQLSAAIGFEWRLLPLHWVTLFLSPEPLFPTGYGMVKAFPWIVPGLAGMAACLVAPPGRGARLAHVPVIGATVTHIALYLCYRDLHPPALWRFYNYHYFKWAVMLLALYALLLLRVVIERHWRAMLAGAVALALLLPWRPELVLQSSPAIAAQSGSVLHLPPLELGIYDAVVIPVHGNFDTIYGGEHNLYVGAHEEKWYSSTASFKTIPVPEGLLLTLLQPLQAGPLTLHLGDGVTLNGDDQPHLARLHLVYGIPCWLPHQIHACTVPDVPGPLRHPGEVLALDGNEGAMLGGGWSIVADGRWTEGGLAKLQLRLTPATARLLQVTAHAFVPPGHAPVEVTITVNGRAVGHWSLSTDDEQVLHAFLPPGIVGPDGAMQIAFAIANPRSPRDSLPNATDPHMLGLSVRSIMIEP